MLLETNINNSNCSLVVIKEAIKASMANRLIKDLIMDQANGTKVLSTNSTLPIMEATIRLA